jgi:MoaA/NifB/PqqE/SkfB family radical SAM enzyme
MNLPLLARRMVRRNKPVQLILFVTARCNLRCKMCFYWEPIENASKQQELTLAEIETLARSMDPFLWLQIGGGEPFIREDLPEIINVFARTNHISHATIPSNGWYTDRMVEVTERLCLENPAVQFNIDLSFCGLGDAHDAIVQQKGAFERLRASHDALQPLRRRLPNLGLGAIFPMSRENHHAWKATLDYLISDCRFDSVVMGKTRGRPKDPGVADVDIDEYSTAAQYLEDAARDGRLRGFAGLTGKIVQAKDTVMRRMIERVSRGGGWEIPCLAGKVSAVVSERGVVYACELLSDPIGDLRRVGMDFQRVWTSPEAEKMRAFIHDSKCFCTHECFLTTNILFTPQTLPLVARELAGNAAARVLG